MAAIARRPRTFRQLARKTIERQLDILCRKVVFARADNGLGAMCELCGAKPAVDWCHIETRAYKSTRWNPGFSWAGCKGCHLAWHLKPSQTMERALDNPVIGPRIHALHIYRAQTHRKVDVELIRLSLESDLLIYGG